MGSRGAGNMKKTDTRSVPSQKCSTGAGPCPPNDPPVFLEGPAKPLDLTSGPPSGFKAVRAA